jgi:hypothetical protein
MMHRGACMQQAAQHEQQDRWYCCWSSAASADLRQRPLIRVESGQRRAHSRRARHAGTRCSTCCRTLRLDKNSWTVGRKTGRQSASAGFGHLERPRPLVTCKGAILLPQRLHKRGVLQRCNASPSAAESRRLVITIAASTRLPRLLLNRLSARIAPAGTTLTNRARNSGCLRRAALGPCWQRSGTAAFAAEANVAACLHHGCHLGVSKGSFVGFST